MPEVIGGGGGGKPSMLGRVNGPGTGVNMVPNSTLHLITFDTVVEDTGGFFNPATPTRLVIPETGLYLLGFYAYFTARDIGYRQGYMRVNNTIPPLYSVSRVVGSLTTNGLVNAATPGRLLAGDYVELLLWQNSGLELGMDSLGGSSVSMWAARL